jgi:hypothetical protein
MKTIKLLLTITLLFTINSYGQLDKKTWLVGGNGSFDSYKQEQSFISQGTGESINVDYDFSNITLNANIGYFFIDKLASGLKISYSDIYGKNNVSFASGGRTFTFGPFIRYYLLKKEKQFNIFVEANYQYGKIDSGRLIKSDDDTKEIINTYSILVGPEVFFNSSVGIEILLGYRNYNQNSTNINNFKMVEKGFQIVVGFQIHLEKK